MGYAQLCYQYCCGEGCSICCMLFSTWGFIFMLVVSILVKGGYQGIDPENAINPAERHVAAAHSFGAAGIYAIITLLCLARYVYIQRMKKQRSLEYIHQEDEM